MKKVLALILCFLMLLPSMAVFAAGEDVDHKELGPKNLYVNELISGTGIDFELVEEKDKTYLHGVVEAGSYGNNSLQFMFVQDQFILQEYPYVKISYRTDSPSSILDTTIRYQGMNKESWPASHPRIETDGKWNTVIINLNTMEKGNGLPGEDVTDVKLVLKPFGQGTANLSSAKYFDIEYITCFKTEADAKKYKYSGTENFVAPESTGSDVAVFGPKNLYTNQFITALGMSLELTEDKDKTYLHGAVEPGTYGNGALQFTFNQSDIMLQEYPFVKISYRTDSPSSRIDTTLRYNGLNKESWPAVHPSVKTDGKWNTVVIDLKTINKGNGFPGEDVTDVKLVIKPLGSDKITTTEAKYFDIEYIACFKTQREANKYEFTGEENIVVPEKPSFGGDFFYEPATAELIDGYMATLDKRIE